ncbi:hypothetical protein EKK97_13860 [Billgrantia tianxiuensis]|uniref:Uncharacterized protein n=1 Tax=Billgrantia tianxiuensis TaxID=2497861 RepID=A0A6I6SRS3_9GAMM|nr:MULTISPECIES: hypothetical protein [Halomonas]MCE8034583.1 hypothetical protein [Halomonas sp. MCCC 1A11057]QHC50450.1 hypothetical protein EKK97_13860 [Halomonas tianxiuensis]
MNMSDRRQQQRRAADTPRHIAQAALIQQMLLDHGRDRASEPVIHDRRMYRITIELVPVDEIADETRRFIEESGHDQ